MYLSHNEKKGTSIVEARGECAGPPVASLVVGQLIAAILRMLVH
jgi:hypothetical protein